MLGNCAKSRGLRQHRLPAEAASRTPGVPHHPRAVLQQSGRTSKKKTPNGHVTVYELASGELVEGSGTQKFQHGRWGPAPTTRPLSSTWALLPFSLGFGGEVGAAKITMHTYEHYTRSKRPRISVRHPLARLPVRWACRLVRVNVLPFEFGQFTETVSTYAEEVAKMASGEDKRKENHLIQERVIRCRCRPTKTFVVPARGGGSPTSILPRCRCIVSLKKVPAPLRGRHGRKPSVPAADPALNQLFADD